MSDRTEIINKQYNHYSSLRKMIFDHVPVDLVDGMFTMLDAVVNTSRQVGYQHALNLLENNNPHWGGVMPVKPPEFTVDEDLQVDYNLSKMANNENKKFYTDMLDQMSDYFSNPPSPIVVPETTFDKMVATYGADNKLYQNYKKDFSDKLNNDYSYSTVVADERKRFIRNLEVGSEVFYTGDVDRGEAARVISIDTRLPIDEATEVIIWLPTNVEVKTNVSFLDPLTQIFLNTRNEFLQRVRPGDRVYYCPDIGEEFYATVVSVMDVAGKRTESTPVTVENHGTLTHGTMEDISSAGF
jgi:hypothetical protein